MDEITLPDGAPPSYSFSMLEMVTLEDAISYTIMCRNTRFIIEISAQRLEGEGGLVDIFYGFKDNLDDPDILCDFETWAIDAIDGHIKRLTLAPGLGSRVGTTLFDYYNAKTYVFELANLNGVLGAIQNSYDPKLHGDSRPRFLITEPDSGGARPQPTDVVTTPTICRSVLPNVPFIPASQLARAAGPEALGEEMCEIPRIVQRVGTDQEYFFKAADDRHGFRREVEILAKILKITEHDPSLLTSRIVGLVSWDDEKAALLGLLLERIDGPSLDEAIEVASAADKRG